MVFQGPGAPVDEVFDHGMVAARKNNLGGELENPAGEQAKICSLFLLHHFMLLFSVGHAAPSFHDIWNLVLPHSASTEAAAVPDRHGELRSRLPTTGEAGDHQGAGEVIDHSKTRVDAGTKAWPFAYYSRRDREGTLDWGIKSWPYIFYSKREDKDDLAASSDAGAAVNYGRKAGHGFRL
ncbi:hypothetical protein Taro_018945 [Colocasia esculenta]|uniref:Uncharacterized protein n=1 Tax=Colocasia esculenta TaxID=4460 RepID=A0A843UJW3_COLES|nr:hypothetical protein [Colocasia esculenta]